MAPIAPDLVRLLLRHAEQHPDRVAATWIDGERQALTFRALWDSARTTAARLRAAGLDRGDRVLILFLSGREFLDAFLGTLLAGGIPVPVAPPFSLLKLEAYREHLAGIAASSGVVRGIAPPPVALALSTSLRQIEHRFRFVEAASSGPPLPEAEIVLPEPGELALLQYTSGSTSQPKGVALSHHNLLSNVHAISTALGCRPEDSAVSWLPLYHDMGLIGMVLTAFYARTPVYLMSPQTFIKDPRSWLAALSAYRATITTAPNFAFGYCVKRLAEDPLPGIRLDSVRAMLNGAEPISAQTLERFAETFRRAGLRREALLPVYGLAESSLAVTFSLGGIQVDVVDASRLEETGEAVVTGEASRRREVVSVGRPIPTQQVRIVDDEGTPLGERKVGEILVRGPSVMTGYYRAPEQTAAALRDGWLRTGDCGYLADGALYISGRKKDLIILRGRNYYPQDLEQSAATVPAVRNGCVIAFALEEPEEPEVVIVAETKRARGEELEAAREAIVKAVSAAFPLRPKVLLVAPGALPRTTSGKLRRQACKQQYLAGHLEPARPSSLATRIRRTARGLRGGLRTILLGQHGRRDAADPVEEKRKP